MFDKCQVLSYQTHPSTRTCIASNLHCFPRATWVMNTSHTMGPEHVPQHGPRTRLTTWALDTSHNMGPEHVSQHGPRARPTTFKASLFYTCHIAAPFVDGCLKQFFSTHAKIAAPFVDGCLKHFFSTHAKISAPFVDGCLKQFFSTHAKIAAPFVDG